MKKTFLVVVVILFAASTLFSTMSLGIIGGLNYADLDPYVDGLKKEADSFSRFCGGIIFEMDLNEYFTFRVEPKYLVRGGTILDALRDVEDVKMKIETPSLELPLLIRTNHENPLNLYLIGGVAFNYHLDSDVDIEVFFPEINDEISYGGNIMDITRTTDFSIIGGWGFKIPINRSTIFVEMKYERGLTNARETGDVTLKGKYMGEELTEVVTLEKEENKYANQGLQVLLGITFSL